MCDDGFWLITPRGGGFPFYGVRGGVIPLNSDTAVRQWQYSSVCGAWWKARTMVVLCCVHIFHDRASCSIQCAVGVRRSIVFRCCFRARDYLATVEPQRRFPRLLANHSTRYRPQTISTQCIALGLTFSILTTCRLPAAVSPPAGRRKQTLNCADHPADISNLAAWSVVECDGCGSEPLDGTVTVTTSCDGADFTPPPSTTSGDTDVGVVGGTPSPAGVVGGTPSPAAASELPSSSGSRRSLLADGNVLRKTGVIVVALVAAAAVLA